MDLGANLKILREAKDLILGQKRFIASRWGGLYTIDLWELTPDLAIAAFNVLFETLTWHKRIRHLGARNLLKLADVSTGIDLKRKRSNNDKSDNKDVCYSYYAVSRLTARPYQGHFKPGEALLDLIYTDLSGIINPHSYNNTSCYATFRNNKIIMSEVYPLVSKSDVVTKFKEFKARYKRPPDRKIRRL